MMEECGTLVKQGAEARIYSVTYLGRPTIIKERFSKSYRHPSLDKSLTSQRTKSEVRSIVRCRMTGISTPAIYHVDLEKGKIYMEYLKDSITVKDYIRQEQKNGSQLESLLPLARRIGEILGKMHANNIIHGDLTTSNMLIRSAKRPSKSSSSVTSGSSIVKDVPKVRSEGSLVTSSVDNTKKSILDSRSGESLPPSTDPSASSIDSPELIDVVMIDFGLGYLESVAEDKGVDLYVLERALLSTHPRTEVLFGAVLETYRTSYGRCAGAASKAAVKDVLAKFEEVRLRGRKRTMVG